MCQNYTGYLDLKNAKSHKNDQGHIFEIEPMLNKSIFHVPGIGYKSGLKLAEQGYDRAFVLYGQFLVFKKDHEKFMDWLIGITGVNKATAKRTAEAFESFASSFL